MFDNQDEWTPAVDLFSILSLLFIFVCAALSALRDIKPDQCKSVKDKIKTISEAVTEFNKSDGFVFLIDDIKNNSSIGSSYSIGGWDIKKENIPIVSKSCSYIMNLLHENDTIIDEIVIKGYSTKKWENVVEGMNALYKQYKTDLMQNIKNLTIDQKRTLLNMDLANKRATTLLLYCYRGVYENQNQITSWYWETVHAQGFGIKEHNEERNNIQLIELFVSYKDKYKVCINSVDHS